MSYEKLIRSWHIRAGEEDYFSKFVFEYLAFIAYVKTMLSNENQTDRRAIQALKRNEIFKEKYLEIVRTNENLKSEWTEVISQLEELPLANASRNLSDVEINRYWNCSHNNHNEKTVEEKNKRSGVIHSLEDWENMVEFWYSVRNNLFHGAKDPQRERDIFAVEYGYKTLKQLVEIFVENLAHPNI